MKNTKINIRPLGDRVVVQPKASEDKTDSGIYIPDTAQKKPHTGSVISVGPGRVENGHGVRMSVKTGDRVMYDDVSGAEYGDYLILREDDILAVLVD